MSVVKMSKIKLMGIDSERDLILNALHKTGAVSVNDCSEELEDTFTIQEPEKEVISERYDRLKNCIEFIQSSVDKAKKAPYYPQNLKGLSNELIISYDDFISISENDVYLFYIVDKVENIVQRLNELKAEKFKNENLKTNLAIYSGIDNKFSDFKDTLKTKVFFGTIPEEYVKKVKESLEEIDFTDFSVLNNGRNSVILTIALNEDAEAVTTILNEGGFNKCPFEYDDTADGVINELTWSVEKAEATENSLLKSICECAKKLKDLKVLCDFYKFQIEKLTKEENFRRTERTFTFDGYFPSERENEVREAINAVTNTYFIEVSEPTENDVVPTLLKNGNAVKQAEFITDMYSVPNYREYDPNRAVFFFFMIFFGAIMADIGYGLILILIGAVLSSRIKVDNGKKRLMNILFYGGIFTIIFGIIFGSFFGVSVKIPYVSFMPDPTDTSGKNIIIVLLSCLALGVFQIAFGYLLKAINSFRRKHFLDALFDALTWVVFFICFVLAAFNFLVVDFFEIAVPLGVVNFFNVVSKPALYVLIGDLALIVVTAGRKEKFLGKFTKGFGSLYGIINLFSDILSYARIFGLMLSGMIIAQTFNNMGAGLIFGGGIGYAFGPLVIVVGHVFNLAMGVLGAYIHDSRLQYIEFFSKFYEGEGVAFKPLGSETDYVYIKK